MAEASNGLDYVPFKRSRAAAVRARWNSLNRIYEDNGWMEHHRKIASMMSPRKQRYLRSSTVLANDTAGRGSQMNGSVLNSIGMVSSRILSSGMMSGITSPARPWFRIGLPLTQAKGRTRAANKWLWTVGQIMLEIIAQSNCYKSLAALYEELGMFGVASSFMGEDFEDVITLQPLTIGEYRIACDAKGNVDTEYRQFVLSVANVVMKFGFENCSQNVQNQWNNRRYDNEVVIMHAVEPNALANPYVLGNGSKKFCSTYIEVASQDDTTSQGRDPDKCLREAFFDYFPYLSPRWSIIGPDAYGYAPGMAALPEMQSVNQLELNKAQMVDRSSRPPLQAPPQFRGKINYQPSGVTFVSDPTGMGIKELFKVDPQAIQQVREEIKIKEDSVKTAFFADLWQQMLDSDRREMTAAEVGERRSEKLVSLGPVLQQVEGDLLMPLIKFVYWRGVTSGIFPDPPDEIKGHPIRVEFVSVMHQAMQNAATAGIERVLGFAGNLAPIFPEVVDNIDIDEAFLTYCDFIGVAPTILNDADKRDAKRQQKAQAAQRQQMLEAAPALATAGANLASVDVGGGDTAAALMAGRTGSAQQPGA